MGCLNINQRGYIHIMGQTESTHLKFDIIYFSVSILGYFTG